MNYRNQIKHMSILAATFFFAFALTMGWSIYQDQMLQEYKIETENQYKRAFNDLGASLNELETSMAKAKAASSPAQKALYMGETWKGSESAVNNLSQLPADEIGMSYIDTFLNQISDFSKTMTRKAASGEPMTAKEIDMFNDMHNKVNDINRAVQKLAQQVYGENLAWLDKPPGLLEKIGFGQKKTAQTMAEGEESKGEQDKNKAEEMGQPPTSVRSGLNQLNDSLQKYPPYTYEGELDKHYVEKPLGLPSGEIDENKAQSIAKEFIQNVGYKDAALQNSGQSQGPMGGFIFTNEDIYLEVSRRGGVITIYRDQREIGERKLDVPKAVDKANAEMKKMGFSSLEIISTQDLDSYIQVDAVALQDGVRLYPDKIRITIAADNGQLVGLDANPFYAFHHKRQLNKVLTLEEAQAKLDKNFKVSESRLALIAKIGTEEAYCYEFSGTLMGEEYLVYINAEDGSEEKISRVVDTPRGKLIQ